MTAYIGDQFDVFYRMSLQKFLNEKAPNLTKALSIDGQIGPGSSAALKLYQAQINLPATGFYDSATQASIEPTLKQRYVQMTDLQDAAITLGVSVGTIATIYTVESSGSGFFRDGTCTILYERHIFYRYLSQDKAFTPEEVAQYVHDYPAIVNPQAGGYVGGEAEWKRFDVAELISDHDAKMAISMGLFQIMGMNYSYCGYQTVEDYFDDQQTSEKAQLKSFIQFVKIYSRGQLWLALRNHDWATFARLYNGPANVVVYSAKLTTAYKANANLAPTPIAVLNA